MNLLKSCEGNTVKLFIVAFLLFIASDSYSQEYNLLLGIGYNQNCKIGESIDAGIVQNLKTLCITKENDSIKIIADIPELIFLRDTTFWRAGIKRSVYNRNIEDQMWITPLNKEVVIKGIDAEKGETCEGSNEYRISYVNDNYIVVYNNGGGYCLGNAHPSFGFDNLWLKIDTLLNDYEWIGELAFNMREDIPKIFDEVFYTKFLLEAKEVYEPLEEETKLALEPIPSQISMYRQSGKWRVEGEYYWSCEVARGTSEQFYVKELPPKSLVGNDELCISWDSIKTLIPDAIDAFSAPDGKTLVVCTGYSLEIYEVDHSKILLNSKLKYEFENDGFSIVMIKWFNDKNETISFLKKLSNDFYQYQYRIYGIY